jgi:hypothetical protein
MNFNIDDKVVLTNAGLIHELPFFKDYTPDLKIHITAHRFGKVIRIYRDKYGEGKHGLTVKVYDDLFKYPGVAWVLPVEHVRLFDKWDEARVVIENAKSIPEIGNYIAKDYETIGSILFSFARLGAAKTLAQGLRSTLMLSPSEIAEQIKNIPTELGLQAKVITLCMLTDDEEE